MKWLRDHISSSPRADPGSGHRIRGSFFAKHIHMSHLPPQAALPSVDRILKQAAVDTLVDRHGRAAVVAAVRGELERLRARLSNEDEAALAAASPESIASAVSAALDAAARPSLRAVFNLSGTVLHTNLGRALLPEEAVQAAMAAATHAVNLEFDLDSGRRDDRDRHIERLLRELSGAERATVVNNNAAAVLLALNTLAQRREVIVSRGELIEIGGEFRMPDIMTRAGCRLVEVGTTNRTHLRDYEQAIGPRTALIMKVHTSNYRIVGFSSAVSEAELAKLAHERGVPLLSDLGAGALLDLRRWGLPYEPTVADMIAAGVDVVTFSGDKLLGGPQAGFIAGRAELVSRINRNALKRALRVDKLRFAALEALLRLYADPDRLATRLPVLRFMTRTAQELEAQARRLQPPLEQALGGSAEVSVEPCESHIGSGSLPGEGVASFALTLRPRPGARGATSKKADDHAAHGGRGVRQSRVEQLARAFRSLPRPVVGRIHEGVLHFDVRCLDDERCFVEQLQQLDFVQPGR
jgi:L-seryl-tRNA(Ser) seleniumtransferase